MQPLKLKAKYEANQKEIKEKSHYIYFLANKIKDDLTNDDIKTCISVLDTHEKEILNKLLLNMKLQVKTPDDFEINRKIYRTIALIIDWACIFQTREKIKDKELQKTTAINLWKIDWDRFRNYFNS